MLAAGASNVDVIKAWAERNWVIAPNSILQVKLRIERNAKLLAEGGSIPKRGRKPSGEPKAAKKEPKPNLVLDFIRNSVDLDVKEVVKQLAKEFGEVRSAAQVETIRANWAKVQLNGGKRPRSPNRPKTAETVSEVVAEAESAIVASDASAASVEAVDATLVDTKAEKRGKNRKSSVNS